MWRQETGFLEMFLAYYSQCEKTLTSEKAYRDFLFDVLCVHEQCVSAGCVMGMEDHVKEEPSSDLEDMTGAEDFIAEDDEMETGAESDNTSYELQPDSGVWRDLTSENVSEPLEKEGEAPGFLVPPSDFSMKIMKDTMEDLRKLREQLNPAPLSEPASDPSAPNIVSVVSLNSAPNSEAPQELAPAASGQADSCAPERPSNEPLSPIVTNVITIATSDEEIPPHERRHSLSSRFLKQMRSDAAEGLSYRCRFCRKIFAQKLSWRAHERSHSKDKIFRCRECDKSFTKPMYLKKHAFLHTGMKPNICAVCGKGFPLKNSLQIHRRTHTGERPFECGVCRKLFRTRPNMKRHERIHTGEKPYVCKECGKAFNQSDSLHVHEAIHLKTAADYKRRFRRRAKLAVDASGQVEANALQCKRCDEAFPDEASLRTHRREAHHKTKPKCALLSMQ